MKEAKRTDISRQFMHHIDCTVYGEAGISCGECSTV
jgi:hypothetical protein